MPTMHFPRKSSQSSEQSPTKAEIMNMAGECGARIDLKSDDMGQYTAVTFTIDRLCMFVQQVISRRPL